MTPHRSLNEYNGVDRNGYTKQSLYAAALKQENEFSVRIIGGEDEDQHLDIVRLFILTCILGGFGRRSRKGMGTVTITDIEGNGKNQNISFDSTVENCENLLNAVAGRKIYDIDSEKKIRLYAMFLVRPIITLILNISTFSHLKKTLAQMKLISKLV